MAVGHIVATKNISDTGRYESVYPPNNIAQMLCSLT